MNLFRSIKNLKPGKTLSFNKHTSTFMTISFVEGKEYISVSGHFIKNRRKTISFDTKQEFLNIMEDKDVDNPVSYLKKCYEVYLRS